MILIKYVIKFITYLLYKTIVKSHLDKKISRSNNKRVLVQINSGIGDSILALPLINQLNIKGYEVHALVNNATETIAKFCPDVKDQYIINYRFREMFKVLGLIYSLNKLKLSYFIGALPSNLIRDAFLPIILRIPIRAKHVSPHKELYRNYDFLFNKITEVDFDKNNVESNLKLLSLINGSSAMRERKFNIILSEDILNESKKKLMKAGYLEEKITIGIHPGCKETWAFKRWPAENYAELIRQVEKEKKLQIILFGGLDDIEIAKRIAGKNKLKILDLVNKLSLDGTMCAISFCNLFVSNDSGLMHIATLFNMPVIGLYGNRSNEVLTGPYGEKNVVIKKDSIENITVKEVYERVDNLLQKIN